MIMYALGPVLEKTEKKVERYVAVLNSDELSDDVKNCEQLNELDKYLQNLRYCKVETGRENITGSFSVPCRVKGRENFCFLVDQKKLVFVDDSGQVGKHIEQEAKHRRWEKPSTGQVLCDFLEILIEDDAENLMEMEAFVEQLAQTILIQEKVEHFKEKIFTFSGRLTIWEHYYEQLMDMGEELEANTLHLFDDECLRKLHIFIARTERLMHNVQMLREYMFQVQNMYQAQIGIRQNKIMQTLTIVTTIFLPLSLLAGWYGMNFRFMPELEWRYSYPLIILLSVGIVVGCVWYFKRKKFW